MRRVIVILCMVLLILIGAVNITFSVGLQAGESDYSGWMKSTLQGTERLIDIRMLGAHDALSSDIRFTSALDDASAALIQKGPMGKLIKGFSVRQSRTQVSDLKDLLEHGVRYLDVRITYAPRKDKWYSTHNYFSRELKPDLLQLAKFLKEHPGEVVLFDIQHIYGIDYSDVNLVTELEKLFTEAGLREHIIHNDGRALSDLTYDQVTKQKSVGAVLVLSKTMQEHSLFWSYKNNLRSAWPDSDSYESVFQFLSEEQELIKSGLALTGNQVQGFEGRDSRQALRVMQGVLTMQMNGMGILDALKEWSLMHRAKSFNPILITHPQFEQWLQAMPIIMVDFSDSAHSEFHNNVMEMIIKANNENNVLYGGN